ncbi:MAG: FKBP-type peptidyl-prolyl cis-trans isomerase [Planctomycetota bacterium]|jgi:FKBP-type peptidyl-prolyl cis-trans isomerase SlyD
MEIKAEAVVAFEYTLTDDKGKVIDSSEGGEPLHYLHGRGHIVPGLEKEMTGKKVGDSFEVNVAAEEAYGPVDPEGVFTMPRDRFPEDQEPKVGMMLGLRSDTGQVVRCRITEVQDKELVLDGNHPLAGMDLTFQVTIAEVREATPDELAHGHAHGPGGHHH